MTNLLPILLLLFTASGCAALIYEVVWFQLLQLVIGSSAISLGLLLAIYMGGSCLGSIAVSRLVSTKHHIITSDPLDPWARGTATVYTREFYSAVKEHLNPAGIFGQFVQLYESNEAAVKSELATFFEGVP